MYFATEPKNLPQMLQATSDTQKLPFGTIAKGYDVIQGAGEFIYLAGVASCVVGSRVTYVPHTGVTTLGDATANSGLPTAFAMAALTAGLFGWFQISGAAIAVNNATAAAGTGKIAAAGAITSAAVTGGQILGGVIAVANGTTFTKTCTTRNGSTQLIVPNFDGLFVGLPVSGTGIAASSVIAAGVDGAPNASGGAPGGGGTVNLNNAMTADGTVVVTFTRTNFSLFGGAGRFAVQGQIT